MTSTEDVDPRKAWDVLRRQARKLESELDSKLSNYTKVVIPPLLLNKRIGKRKSVCANVPLKVCMCWLSCFQLHTSESFFNGVSPGSREGEIAVEGLEADIEILLNRLTDTNDALSRCCKGDTVKGRERRRMVVYTTLHAHILYVFSKRKEKKRPPRINAQTR